jgi:hypothetical protein
MSQKTEKSLDRFAFKWKVESETYEEIKDQNAKSESPNLRTSEQVRAAR